jgi:hypothetical protein
MNHNHTIWSAGTLQHDKVTSGGLDGTESTSHRVELVHLVPPTTTWSHSHIGSLLQVKHSPSRSESAQHPGGHVATLDPRPRQEIDHALDRAVLEKGMNVLQIPGATSATSVP